ncbi:hypothetical protein GGU10DRAFT_375745 [Lentinula aff. detonsa]|uniref:MYND-type domain-containing protein n=1 Tax=Lentinula aff. detonsa TaxID=2804958 RepID=A0AA38KA52_9AGAR|nr:hypothetical protein GGU10DRAFT_375745 [Lentinula aff. detonsa]
MIGPTADVATHGGGSIEGLELCSHIPPANSLIFAMSALPPVAPGFHLQNRTYFPRAIDLPELGYDEDETMRFFSGPRKDPLPYLYRTFRTDKRIHWCFLGELAPSLIRGMIGLRAHGETFPFDIVTGPANWEDDRRSLLPQILPRLKEGYCIALMYAQRTYNFNLAVERAEMIKIFPFSLDELQALLRRRNSPLSETCLECGTPATQVCSRCKLGPYCSKVSNWKNKHKQECAVVEQLMEWSSTDWSTYDSDRMPL